ncbi:MAG: alpha/beta hydrolase [Anaerolineae bacterium]|nr:alpha/beta hydrolase [Anaerolineae bacterium]
MTQKLLYLPDQAKLSYYDSGTKRPLLLIHGNTGTAQTHLGNIISQLQASHRIIAPDLRGYGASQPPQRTYPANFYQRDADDMATLLKHLDCGPVIVLGFSDGSESAILLAAAHPELVRGVIGWGISGIISPEMLKRVQAWLPVPDKDNWEDWHKQIATLHGETQVQPMIEGWVNAANTIAANGGNICLKEAAQVTCPTLLINGDAEVGNTVRDVTRLKERLPQGQLEIVAHSRHAIQKDQPEKLLQLITAFLDKIDA